MIVSKLFYKDQECVSVEDLPHFNLSQIMKSGQCFRINELPPVYPGAKRAYSVCWGLWHVSVDELPRPGAFIFHCTAEDFFNRWLTYFSLDFDYYPMLERQLSKTPDEFLSAAAEYGNGIRILNQGLWEALICFMISQNNNIKRITKTVEDLCRRYGEHKNDRGAEYYTFPSPMALVDADFSGLGLGYREAYFREMFSRDRVEQFSEWYCKVSVANYDEAKELLMQAKGIGNKVADCVCLYGLHLMEAYPIDTWMKKIISQVYGGVFDTSAYNDYAGYVQQLQFFYFRSKELIK